MPLGYYFEIKYGKTTDFGQADRFSRLFNNQYWSDKEAVIASVTVENDVRLALSNSMHYNPVTVVDVRLKRANDEVLRQAIKLIKSVGNIFTQRRTYELISPLIFFIRIGSCLMQAGRLVIPSILKQRVLWQFYSRYFGVCRMKLFAKGCNYWTGMYKDIESPVHRYNKFQQAAKHFIQQVPVLWPQTEVSWSRPHLELAGHFW